MRTNNPSQESSFWWLTGKPARTLAGATIQRNPGARPTARDKRGFT